MQRGRKALFNYLISDNKCTQELYRIRQEYVQSELNKYKNKYNYRKVGIK